MYESQNLLHIVCAHCNAYIERDKFRIINVVLSILFEKDSFWLSKGVLLVCKRTRFAPQKDSFCNAKGLVLEMRGICPRIFKGFSCIFKRLSH